MSKMVIMQGLPASGKSTRAEEIERSMGNAVRINKDLLRTMLHSVIDDRPSVIRMWKENGLNVIDVGNGEEF